MALTFGNATLHILIQPKSSPGIDPSQSNYLSSKMSFHIYSKSDFVNPENIAAFLAYFQQIRTHPRIIILLRSRRKKTVLKASLARTKCCAQNDRHFNTNSLMTGKTGNYRGWLRGWRLGATGLFGGNFKNIFWFPAKKTKQNKTKQERKKNCLTATRSKSSVKICANLTWRWQWSCD